VQVESKRAGLQLKRRKEERKEERKEGRKDHGMM
jgi:hypothetical protein